MWKRELLKNKLYALLLVGLSLPIMFLDGDATATVLMLFFAVPMFFAKENWIMGGTYATQESRRKSVRRCTYRSGSWPSTTENTSPKSTRPFCGCCMNNLGSGLNGSEPITMPSTTASRSWSVDMRWRTRMIFGSVPRC